MRVSRWAGICIAAVSALVAATLVAPAASAAPAEPDLAGHRAPAFYLSLGDSLGYGLEEDRYQEFAEALSEGQPDAAAIFTGYTDLLATDLGVRASTVENLSCPEETTSTMISGGCGWLTDPPTLPGFPAPAPGSLPLHVPTYSGSQLSAATAFLSHHRWQRGLITLSIGSDDVLTMLEDPANASCLTSLSCPALSGTLRTVRDNLSTILSTLRRAAPRATVVVLAPYNPFGYAIPLSNLIAVQVDLTIAVVAWLHGDKVADGFAAINLRSTPADCGVLISYCAATGDTDVHPTAAGYQALALAFEKALA